MLSIQISKVSCYLYRLFYMLSSCFPKKWVLQKNQIAQSTIFLRHICLVFFPILINQLVNLFLSVILSIFQFVKENTLENPRIVIVFCKYFVSEINEIFTDDSDLGLFGKVVSFFRFSLILLHDYACFYIPFVVLFGLMSSLE